MSQRQTRLTTNAVIQRDFERPMIISKFVKDLHSAFQVLNLKNDSLRRRGDTLKYNVSVACFNSRIYWFNI